MIDNDGTPTNIVSTEWLARNAGREDLRIYDCTTRLYYATEPGVPYTYENGVAEYRQGHIPGSSLLMLQEELSDSRSPYLFAIPSPERLAEGFGRAGIGDDTDVVLYSRDNPQWAARIWWMLRAIGFERAAILDGGWNKWAAEGRPVSLEGKVYHAAQLSVRPHEVCFVHKEDVLAALDDPGVLLINTLSPEIFEGKSDRYGRPGHIPGSINVPAVSLIDPEQRTVLDAERRAEILERPELADKTRRIITYCGGGIWGAWVAFILHEHGYENVAVYDGSMSEWGFDEHLPMALPADA